MKKITDIEIANFFDVSDTTIRNYKKGSNGKQELYKAMRYYCEKGAIDDEYFIESLKEHFVYRTIRNQEPLFAYFNKSDLAVQVISAELENDIEEIQELVNKQTSCLPFTASTIINYP